MSHVIVPPDPTWAMPFLLALEQHHGLRASAARAVGTTVRAVEQHMQESEDFAFAVSEREAAIIDKLEIEAHRRAVIGVAKGVYFKGELVDTEVQYSDGLLQTLLKAKRPQTFGDKKEIALSGGATLRVDVRAFPLPPDTDARAPNTAPALASGTAPIPTGTTIDGTATRLPAGASTLAAPAAPTGASTLAAPAAPAVTLAAPSFAVTSFPLPDLIDADDLA